MSDVRVAITGMGQISALGTGRDEMWSAIERGHCGIRNHTLSVGDFSLEIPAGLVENFDPLQHFREDELLLRDPYALFAIIAAREAMKGAGLPDAGFVPERAGVILGSGAGGEHAREAAAWRFLGEGKARCNPVLVPRTNHQASVGFTSMELGITGPSMVVATGCASSNHAMSQAWLMIKQGMLDIAITGGSDSNVVYTNVKAFDALRVLARDTCRPFSAERKGMVMGEGAGVLILENMDRARKRGTNIIAELAGVGMSADATDPVHPAAKGPAQAIKAALKSANLSPDQVEYINAHGTGTPVNDAEECKAIRLALGPAAEKIALSSTKSMHGHALGGVGGLELVATLLGMKNGALPPCANYIGPDPDCDLDIVANVPRERKIDVALSNAFAFGGLNAVLAIKSV